MSAFTNKFIYNIYISLYNLFIYKFTNKYIYREREKEGRNVKRWPLLLKPLKRIVPFI